jgi:hypothetical protein
MFRGNVIPWRLARPLENMPSATTFSRSREPAAATSATEIRPENDSATQVTFEGHKPLWFRLPCQPGPDHPVLLIFCRSFFPIFKDPDLVLLATSVNEGFIDGRPV